MKQYIGVEWNDTCVYAGVWDQGQCSVLWEAKHAGEMDFLNQLTQLIHALEEQQGIGIENLVIAVPGWYGEGRRKAMIEACHLALQKKPRLMGAAGAAALASYIRNPAESEEGQLHMVLRLETGLDVAFADSGMNVVEVMSSACDSSLSEESYRMRVCYALANAFRQEHDIDISQNTGAMDLLRQASQKAIADLARNRHAVVQIPDLADGKSLQVMLSREQFQQMTKDLTARIRNLVSKLKKGLTDSGAKCARVVMDPCAYKITALQQMLLQELGNPQLLCAEGTRDALYGAAARGACLEGSIPYLMMDTIGYGMELEARIPLIETDYTVPISVKMHRFQKNRKPYGTIALTVRQLDQSAEPRRIRYVIRQIPEAKKNDPGIDVTVEVDMDGLYSLKAVDVASGKELTVELAPEDLADYPLIPRAYEDPAKNLMDKEGLVRKLLPTYDNLQRAMEQSTADKAYQKGVELTMKELERTLDSMGVTFYGAVGERFDPAIHNALVHIYDSNRSEQEITLVIERGVRMDGKILRYAGVQVAN